MPRVLTVVPLRTGTRIRQRPRGRQAVPVSCAFGVLLLAGLLGSACDDTLPPPVIQVQRDLLTVDNRTPQDWTSVEIWINRQYRVTVPRIASRSRFSTTLDVFVAGFGQRFDVRRQRIDQLTLKARQPDGTVVEHELGERR
jgi:hypothetical protein